MKKFWEKQNKGMKVYIASLSVIGILLACLFVNAFIQEQERIAAAVEDEMEEEYGWSDTESSSYDDSESTETETIVSHDETIKEDENEVDGYTDAEAVRNGTSFLVGVQTTLNPSSQDWALRNTNLYAHVPVSGKYKVELLSREPQDYDEEGEEPTGDFKVQISSLGKVREERTAERGNTGWISLSIGETYEVVIDKKDMFHMSEGTTFQLTLIEAQE